MGKGWAVVLPVVALAASPASAGELIYNGGFEFGGTGPAAPVPGWAVERTSDVNSVQVLTGRDYQRCCGLTGTPAQLDNQFVAFGAGDSPTTLNDRIYQSFFPGQGTYRLRFDVGAIGGAHQLRTSIYDFSRQAFIFDVSLLVAGRTDFGGLPYGYDGLFRSAGGEHSIQFSGNFSDTRGADVLLDNVSVVRVGGVPEPTVWAMMMLSFGLIGTALRRRLRLSPAPLNGTA